MKKIWGLIIALFFIPVYVNAQAESGYSKSHQNIYVEGKANSGSIVTILLKDSLGAVKYIGECSVDGDNKYFSKFKIKSDISDCTLYVNDGNNDISKNVTIHEVKSEYICKFSLKDSNSNARITNGEIVKSIANITNKCGNDCTVSGVIASYDKSDKMIGCHAFSNRTIGFWDIETKLEDVSEITIPQNAEKVKAFLWTNEIIPIAKSQTRMIGDERFTGDDGKITVAFIGDSITELANYLPIIEHYYQTRYPDKDIMFVNKGISGSTANGVISRFENDIKNDQYTGVVDEATLMIGMNDVGASDYPDGEKEKKDANINKCITNIESIINMCKKADISLTLITPSAYDESEEVDLGICRTGINSYGLKSISEKVMELSEEYDIPVIDLWTPTTEAISQQRLGGNTGVVLASDRVHPNANGGFFMGYQFIKQQCKDSMVANVSIDVTTGTADTENADVIISKFNKEGVTYSYNPKSLPIAYTDSYKYVEDTFGYSVTEDINREIIKVTGLSEGSYSVSMDENILGIYSSSELTNGINIAINKNNPGQLQAMDAYSILEQKIKAESLYRGIARTEANMKYFGVYTLEEISTKLPAYAATYERYFSDSGFGAKVEQEKSWNTIKTLDNEAKQHSVPKAHTVTIDKQ